ncbi:hypothetical protein JCM3770_000534 [Rhodotorula araucariae]
MCQSAATLFFGITVPALQLVVAARAWPKVRAAARAVNWISTLREAGTLRFTSKCDGVLFRVPGEIWQLIKVHTAESITEDEEDALVADVHAIGTDECQCTVCSRATSRERTDKPSLRYKLSHMSSCDDCQDALCTLEGVEGLLENNEQTISRMLTSFDLVFPASHPISQAGCPSLDLQASAAIALPRSASAGTEASHVTADCEHELLEIDPSFFVLPSDAQTRFRSFLRWFPLEVTDETSGKTVANDSHSLRSMKKKTKKSAVNGRGPAKWHLWSSTCDCI